MPGRHHCKARSFTLIPQATHTETAFLADVAPDYFRADAIEDTEPCVDVIDLRRCPPATEIVNAEEATTVVAAATRQT